MVKEKVKLPKSGKQLEEILVSTYGIKTGVGSALIEVAKQALDQALAAEKLIEEHGQLIQNGRGGLKANPACAVSRDARNRLLAAVSKLNLEV